MATTTNKFNQNACTNTKIVWDRDERPEVILSHSAIRVMPMYLSVAFIFAVSLLLLLLLVLCSCFNVIQYQSSIYSLYLPKSHDLCEHWQSSHFHSLLTLFSKFIFNHNNSTHTTGREASLNCVKHAFGLNGLFDAECYVWVCVSVFVFMFGKIRKTQIDSIQRTTTNNYPKSGGREGEKENQKEDNHSNCKCV